MTTRKSILPAEGVAAPAAPALPPYSIETWPVERLKAYERNARTHSAQQIRQLRSSFQKFGQVWPILVRPGGTIIAGHGRLEAAKGEGLTEVRVIVAEGWSEEQCRAFGLLDNRVALNSEWDETLLGAELSDLNAAGVDLGELGFDGKELDELLASGGTVGLTDPDAAPAATEAPVSVAGDCWLMGRHRLLCGDSTSPGAASRVLNGSVPLLMVTDPPYGVEYDPSWRGAAGVGSKGAAVGKVLNDHRADWREAWALFPGDVAYVWHGALHAETVTQSLRAAGFEVRSQIIWAKTRPVLSRGHYHWQHEPAFLAERPSPDDGPVEIVQDHELGAYVVRLGRTGNWHGGRRQSTVWSIEHLKSDTGHGTQKPVECMKRPIENNSAPGELVYEPFSGSGTTIIAAEMTGRGCYAIELSPVYVDVAVKRWQDFTGLTAKLEGDGRTFAEVAAERRVAAAA